MVNESMEPTETSITGKLGMSRVKREMKDLYGQALVGTLLRTVAVGLRDAALIALALLSADAVLKWAVESECAQSCFDMGAHGCCWTSTSVLLRLPIAAFICYWGGFVSTTRRPVSKFQHSALVSSILILALTGVLICTPLPLWLNALFGITLFVSLYQGYQRCFG